MARKTEYSMQSHESPGVHRVSGSFTTAGASAPSTTTGAGFTVSAPSTGVYTITGRGTFPGYISFGANLLGSTGSNDDVLFTAIAPTTNPWTATIETQSSAGTAANLTGPVVGFWIEFRNTNSTK